MRHQLLNPQVQIHNMVHENASHRRHLVSILMVALIVANCLVGLVGLLSGGHIAT